MRIFQGWEMWQVGLSKVGKLLPLVAIFLAGAVVAGEPRVVTTGQMELEFRDGWLTRWKNKLTDEEIRFGSGKLIPESASAEFLKADDSTAALTQAGASIWAVRVPRGSVAVMHGAAGVFRQRYLLIQAAHSGLLLMLDDPRLACRASLERDDARRASTLTFHTTAPSQTPARWLIKQYIGSSNWGAQHRLNYLTSSQNLKLSDRRPTAWAQNIVFITLDPPWCQPVAGLGWGQSREVHHAWLDNLQRVVDPDKLMFCVRNVSTTAGLASPYAVLMTGRVRRMGYHVMLRFAPSGESLPQRGDNEMERQAQVGAIIGALRAVDADAVWLEDFPVDDVAGESQLVRQLRAELDQQGLSTVALGVAGEPPEAALPYLDFSGETDPAVAVLLRGGPTCSAPPPPYDQLCGQAPLQAQLGLDALLTDEERLTFGLPPRAPGPLFTRLQFGLFALARWWGENQPRRLEPKFCEPGDLARYRLNDDQVLRLVTVDADTLRLVVDKGGIVADLNKLGWTNNAALLERYGPAFLKDKTEP